MKKIILTGGGTGGHVIPALALLPELKSEGYDIYYIGSKDGIEKDIVKEAKLEYYSISSGKLRRYLDIKNFTDIFKIIKGVGDAFKVINSIKPNIIFSKGGFVSVPVILAGKICKIPIVIHESDITPGLANKIATPFAKAICVSFPEAIDKIDKKKCVLTGTPIREDLFKGNKEKGLSLLKFNNNKPIIIMMGGSQGSKKLNEYLRNSLNKLLKTYNVIHICGKGNLDESLNLIDGYKQYEYISHELPHLFETASIVISRAGANSLFEILALKKPNLLIPLSKSVSRGDQILNASSFYSQGFSKVIEEEFLTEEVFLEQIEELFNQKDVYIKNMENSKFQNGVKEIVDVIKKYTK